MKAIIALIVVIILGGIVLFLNWSDKENTDSDYEVTKEITTSEQTLFIPSGYRRLEEDNIIVLDVSVLPGTLNSMWAIYGKDVQNLNTETTHQSSELGMGTAGQYGWYSIVIPPENLEPGISYFYRIAGETTDGDIFYSGLNSFTAGK